MATTHVQLFAKQPSAFFRLLLGAVKFETKEYVYIASKYIGKPWLLVSDRRE